MQVINKSKIILIFIIFHLKATDKGNVSIFDMLLDKKVGFLFNEFYGKELEEQIYVNEDFKFNCLTVHKSGKMAVFASQNGNLNIIKT